MERKLSITNLTSVSIDVYRSDFTSVTLHHQDVFNCETEECMCIHGHSRSGSFVVGKELAQYRFKTFGKLTVTTSQSTDCFSISVLEKK